MPRFKKIYIETTNICNLSCNFCPKTKRKLENMTLENFKIILDKVRPFTDYIYLHLMGEPLLNKHLGEFLEAAKTRGFKINITTNGTLLKTNGKAIIESNAVRQINISLHSFEANKEVDFYKYINEITDFVNEANERTDTICALRLWNMDSEYEAENKLNDEIMGILEKNLNIDFSLEEHFKLKPNAKVRDRVYIMTAEKFKWPVMGGLPASERSFCYGLRTQLGILVDGTVVPCCIDSDGNIPLGNIFEEDLETIITTDRAKAIYEGFSCGKAVEDLCKKCGFTDRTK
ncbi:radical SAM/SPASM domain-containing protein [uncultured Clostridium sp.]|jgi:MoaA/NifB/PqqE/SkfB family radical SAM enzyme|uniref:radical SAM/SPASM domain-containing protein n=1 Tax=uncultured Clostridium sp. TaxID=59620 RepID=UPI002622AF1C|nr:radical SAM/SPASM domain-containing protein [uncultured Clostridium sp.]